MDVFLIYRKIEVTIESREIVMLFLNKEKFSLENIVKNTRNFFDTEKR